MKKRILAVLIGAGLLVGSAAPAMAWEGPGGHKCTGQTGPKYGCQGDDSPPGQTNNPNPGK
jgi:hypothetical protein